MVWPSGLISPSLAPGKKMLGSDKVVSTHCDSYLPNVNVTTNGWFYIWYNPKCLIRRATYFSLSGSVDLKVVYTVYMCTNRSTLLRYL